jgi:hypothetical protein
MPQLSRRPMRAPGRGRVTVERVMELTTGREADVPVVLLAGNPGEAS